MSALVHAVVLVCREWWVLTARERGGGQQAPSSARTLSRRDAMCYVLCPSPCQQHPLLFSLSGWLSTGQSLSSEKGGSPTLKQEGWNRTSLLSTSQEPCPLLLLMEFLKKLVRWDLLTIPLQEKKKSRLNIISQQGIQIKTTMRHLHIYQNGWCEMDEWDRGWWDMSSQKSSNIAGGSVNQYNHSGQLFVRVTY